MTSGIRVQVRRRASAAACLLVAVVSAAACAGPQRPKVDSLIGSSSVAGPSSAPSSSLTSSVYKPYAGAKAAVAATGRVTRGQLVTTDGRTRRYRLYVPASLVPSKRVPLLVALHGGMGTAEQFAATSGFDGLAEANRFIVVYPDGVGIGSEGTALQTWNGGYCCGPAVAQGVDDVGFIRQLLQELAAQLPIDAKRVYAAGHSNGAIMAYRLACELADRIVAVGVQAGSLGVDRCAPSQPVSVFHVHGTGDTNHPIDGGQGSGVSNVVFRPARAAVEALAAADGCQGPPALANDPKNADLSVSTWSTSCRGRSVVRYVVVAGATHAWMGHPASSDYVGEPYAALDASRAIWSFLTGRKR